MTPYELLRINCWLFGRKTLVMTTGAGKGRHLVFDRERTLAGDGRTIYLRRRFVYVDSWPEVCVADRDYAEGETLTVSAEDVAAIDASVKRGEPYPRAAAGRAESVPVTS